MAGRLLEGHRRARQAWGECKMVGNMRELLLLEENRRERLLWVESRMGQLLEVHRREEELLWVIHRRVWQPLVGHRRNWVWTLVLHKTKTGRTW